MKASYARELSARNTGRAIQSELEGIFHHIRAATEEAKYYVVCVKELSDPARKSLEEDGYTIEIMHPRPSDVFRIQTKISWEKE